MNARVRSEAQADVMIEMLARIRNFSGKKIPQANATFPFLVESDAPREVIQAVLCDVAAHFRAIAPTRSAKLRTEASADALVAFFQKLGHTAEKKRHSSKAFPFTVQTDATRETLLFGLKQTEQKVGGVIGACRTEFEAKEIEKLLKALGYTAERSINKRSRANPYNIATNADRATLRSVLNQAGEALFAEQLKNAGKDGAAARARELAGGR